jgi:hypothetical protein
MDSIMIEALVEARRLLDDLPGVPGAHTIRIRRELLEHAASTIELRASPPSHVVRLTKLILDVRDEAVALHRSHKVVVAAIGAAMD